MEWWGWRRHDKLRDWHYSEWGWRDEVADVLPLALCALLAWALIVGSGLYVLHTGGMVVRCG